MPEIHFLPWAEWRTATDIGHVRISPWSDVREAVEASTSEYLDTLFSRHQGNDGRTVHGLAVASVGDDVLAVLSGEESQAIRRAVDALTFATVVPSILANVASENPSPGVPHAERFQLVTQRFDVKNPYVSVVSGGTMHVWGIKKIHFCSPWHVGTSLYRLNEDMLKACGALLKQAPVVENTNRIFRALEWFRLAHTGSDETSHFSRAVMMSTMFEILLEPRDRREKRLGMTGRLNELTARTTLRTGTVQIGNDTVELNAVALWLNDFYKLRNAIVHGDSIDIEQLRYPVPGRDWLTHLDVAAMVAWEVVGWLLVSEGLLGRKAREEADWLSQQFGKEHADESFVRQVTAGIAGINVDAYHEDLGWTQPQSSSAV